MTEPRRRPEPKPETPIIDGRAGRRVPPGRTEPEYDPGIRLGVACAGALLLFAVGMALGFVLDDDPTPSPAPAATTTTSLAPYCDTSSGWMVYPGTGIMAGHPDCPSPPPQHDPPGTGPTTGPNGEQHG